MNEVTTRAITQTYPKSLLELAIERGSLELVQLFILKGVDLCQENCREQIPLEFARRHLKDEGHPIIKLLKEHTLACRRPWRGPSTNPPPAYNDVSPPTITTDPTVLRLPLSSQLLTPKVKLTGPHEHSSGILPTDTRQPLDG